MKRLFCVFVLIFSCVFVGFTEENGGYIFSHIAPGQKNSISIDETKTEHGYLYTIYAFTFSSSSTAEEVSIGFGEKEKAFECAYSCINQNENYVPYLKDLGYTKLSECFYNNQGYLIKYTEYLCFK